MYLPSILKNRVLSHEDNLASRDFPQLAFYHALTCLCFNDDIEHDNDNYNNDDDHDNGSHICTLLYARV